MFETKLQKNRIFRGAGYSLIETGVLFVFSRNPLERKRRSFASFLISYLISHLSNGHFCYFSK